MIAKVISSSIVGLDAVPVEVEVHIIKKGLPSFQIVGLPDKAVSEARERVRSALLSTGAEFPVARIVVNLAPADLPKEGPSFDLPIALGILLADEQIQMDVSDVVIAGELSLDGNVRHINGVLSHALMAKQYGFSRLFVPKVDAREASVVGDIVVFGVDTLESFIAHIRAVTPILPSSPISFSSFKTPAISSFDMELVKGQEQAKRGMELAAAGGHNIMLRGVPGAGKTMLARSFPTILPSVSEEEALEVTKIYSITGNMPRGTSIIAIRPFRSPHHTTSRVGLIGGGGKPMPGEISLAHRGVLFLDELPEFPKSTLEALRQPLEDGFVSIARAAGQVTYPAQFILVAAANPCPCGNLGSKHKHCGCMPGQILRYKRKVSGALLDRIDLHVYCPELSPDELSKLSPGEKSIDIRLRVERARALQRKRFVGSSVQCNAEMTGRELREWCTLSTECIEMLKRAVHTFHLSARSYHKMIKVARTIADLHDSNDILTDHLAEAFRYRIKDEE